MLVRVLASAETTGEVTCLLLDKTGTLTVNEQRVRRAWIAGVDVGPLDHADDAARTKAIIAHDTAELDDAVLKLASILLAMNTTVTYDGEGHILRGGRQEIALLRFVQSLNDDDESFATTIRHHFPLVKLFPFTTERKRMCTLFMLRDGVEDEEAGARVVVRAAVKGAARDVLSQCSSVLNARGEKHPLDDSTRSTLSRRFESWQRDAERALLIAYRDVERERVSPRDATTLCERMSVESAESELTLVAAVGMSDPVRVEAPKSVETCRRAGVAVKMVTGDSLCPPPSPWRDGAAF